LVEDQFRLEDNVYTALKLTVRILLAGDVAERR
jgi:hypothetical protein